MEPIPSAEYDAVVDKSKEWQSYPWGQLLYRIACFNINRHKDNQLTPLYSSAEVSAILRTYGFEVVGDNGVRCVCDYLPNEPKYEEAYFDALVRLESRLTDTYLYNLLTRFYQVIVQKTSG